MVRCVAKSLQRVRGDDMTFAIDYLAKALLQRLSYEDVCNNHPLFSDQETCQDNDCTDRQCKKMHFDS